MSVIRRSAAAFAVVGLGVLAYAVPASATGSEHSSLPCVDGRVQDNLFASIDAEDGVGVVQGRGGAPICEGTESPVTLSIYRVPDTWDGTAFPGGHKDPKGVAYPQTALQHDQGYAAGSKPVKLHVTVPDCGNVQIDLYMGAPIDHIDVNGHPRDKQLAGYIWSIGGPNGYPAKCTPPTPTPTYTTPAPTPTETTPSPTPSVTPTETTPAPTTSAPTETTPAPTPSETETSPVAPPTQSQSSPIPVVPIASTPPAPPVLASTGSNTTVPLIGFGVGLVGLGVLLSVFARRRKTA
jgi:LPXTG-motif cell wall-anchored protein